MKRFSNILALLALSLSSAGAVRAGTIVLLADSNATSVLGANDNGLFFNRILNGGSSVLITQGSLGAGLSTGQNVNNYYLTQPGVSSSIFSGTITSATLTGVSLLVNALPDANYTASEILAIQSFLTGGGRLLLITENYVFPVQNGAVNALLTALGSTMQSVQGAFQDNNFMTTTAAQVVPNALTAGITSFVYAGPNSVAGGHPLLLESDLATPFAAYDGTLVSVEGVPEPGTFAMLGLSVMLGVWVRRRT